jgi:hypothetical protein
MLQICKTYNSFGCNLTIGTVKHNDPNFSTVLFVPQWEIKGFGLFNKSHHQVIWTRKLRENSKFYMFNYFAFCLATLFQCEFSSECDLVLPLYRPKRKYASLCVFVW